MTSGYDEARPGRELYDAFFNEISCLDNLLVYGSYARGTHHASISDIDALLITKDEGVIDFSSLQACFIKAQPMIGSGTRIPFQINVIDAFMAKDGRFFTFNDAYKQNFLREGRTKNDANLLDHASFINYKSNELSSFGHDLRKLRENFLQAPFYQQYNYGTFVKSFDSALKGIRTMAKKVLLLSGIEDYEKTNTLDQLRNIYPQLHHEELERIAWYHQRLDELDGLYRQPKNLFGLWEDGVAYTESLCTLYLQTHPRRDIYASVVIS